MSGLQHCIDEALGILGKDSEDWATKVRLTIGYLELLALGSEPPAPAEIRRNLESLAAKLRAVELAVAALPTYFQNLPFTSLQSLSAMPRGLALQEICAEIRNGALQFADSIDVKPSGPRVDTLHRQAAREARALLLEADPTARLTKYREGRFIRLTECLVQAAQRLDEPPTVDRACKRVLEEPEPQRTE